MPNTEGKQGSSTNQQRHWHQHAVVWAAVAAALGAALAAAANGYQAYLTRQNNVVSQRAFVYVDGPVQLVVALDAKDRSKIVNFPIRLNNSGNTPTKDMGIFIRCAPSIDAMPEPWVLLYRDTPDKLPQIIGASSNSNAGLCVFVDTIATNEGRQASRLFDGRNYLPG
jgi:hypothetical protein